MKIVIFCGGFGTRMWPVSRKSFPKQFYPLIGGKSFFEITVARFKKEFKPEDIFVSTEGKYLKFIQEQAPDIPKENIIGEPERKDNLAAVGLVTALINKRFPGETIMASWCDHIIKKEEKFLKAVKVAGDYASQSGMIVSINQKPEFPSTQNEWVEMGSRVGELREFKLFQVVQTVKRPKLVEAKKMYASESYVLNTGYRVWKCDVMLGFFKTYQPEMYGGLMKIVNSDKNKYDEKVLNEEYSKFIKESIEFGLFVKLPGDKSVTIASNFGWKDVGTWEFFYDTFASYKHLNVTEGSESEFIDADSNLVIGSSKKLITIVGLSHIAVIDTDDGLLVCNLDETAKVKDLFTKLEKEKPKYVD